MSVRIVIRDTRRTGPDWRKAVLGLGGTVRAVAVLLNLILSTVPSAEKHFRKEQSYPSTHKENRDLECRGPDSNRHVG